MPSSGQVRNVADTDSACARIDAFGEAVRPGSPCLPQGHARTAARQERSDDGWILVSIDDEIVSVTPVETFRDDRHTLGNVADKSDRRCVHCPGASDTGAGTGNLRFLRDPAGHAAALVTEITGKGGCMAMQAGALPAGAKMSDAIGDDEIPRIEQRSFAA